MGRVFSFADIQAGKIPKPEYFDAAKHITLEWMQSLLRDREIVGGQIFGSVASKTASKRSDFDLILVTTDYTIPDNIGGHKRLMEAAFHIPMEPILIPSEFANTTLHSMDSDFLHHMSQVGGENVVGEHPALLIKPNNPDITQVHTSYLASKLRKFRDGTFIVGEDAKLKTLQRALEAPISIGRRTLRTLGIPQTNDAGEFDDTKRNIAKIFRENFSETPIGEGFNTCLAQDMTYSDLLESAVQGDVSQAEYEGFILREGYDLALAQSLAWTSDISLFFHRAVEGNRSQAEGQQSFRERL